MASDPNLLTPLLIDPPLPSASYRVTGRLSRGGMGDILLAERTAFDGTTERVVLKRLSPELEEEPYISMFLSEAKVMARLDHPNVVRLLDMPLVDDAHCLALELVHGTNLYQLMRRARETNEKVPVELAVYVGLELLAGLSYAHAARVDGVPINLVHRDVKPGNVLLSRDGEVKLTDFGISKSSLSILKTTRGVVKGTPHYLAPEQVKGDPATPRSDLYSLAVVMVEAISGITLFKRETMASTLLAVSMGERIEVERLLPRQHRALARVLERALTVEPQRRFESAAAMASAIAGACPIDDGQAKKELARRVRRIYEESGQAKRAASEASEAGSRGPARPGPNDPLNGGPRARKMSDTGAIPLEPSEFGEDSPTPRADKITKPIRPPPLAVQPRVDRKVLHLTFLLGVLVGALVMCGLQVALQLIAWPAPW